LIPDSRKFVLMSNPIRPAQGEFAPYAALYIDRVPDGDIVATLETQLETTLALLRHVPEERAGYAYAAGKWTVREVVGHVADTERVLAYRALRIGRGDATPLPGFDENAFVSHAGFNGRTLDQLLAELDAVRRATTALARGLPPEAWTRRGTADGAPFTVRGLLFMIAGHELHHRAILEERYLS
jgi:uncharacterized damage-inducible protein DinB